MLSEGFVQLAEAEQTLQVKLDVAERIAASRIHYVDDFTFLAMFYSADFEWVGPYYSGLDIETEGVLLPHDGEIATVQIELNGECWAVHWDNTKTINDVIGIDCFTDYLRCQKVTKVIHNVKFEAAWFIKAFGYDFITAPVYDTMGGEYLLAEGAGEDTDNYFKKPKLSLGDIVFKRYAVEMDKDKALRTGFRRKGNCVTHPALKAGGVPVCVDCGGEAFYRVGSLNTCQVCVEVVEAYKTKAGKPRARKDIDLAAYMPYQELKGDLSERELNYAAFDALWAMQLAYDQIEQMTMLELNGGENYLAIAQLDSAAAEVIASMELPGIPINLMELECLDAELQYREQTLREDIEEACCFETILPLLREADPDVEEHELPVRLGYWKEPNKAQLKKDPDAQAKFVEATDYPKISSNEQMVPRLQALGYPVPTYEGHELRHFKDDPFIKSILEWKGLTTLQGTFTDGFLRRYHRVTGRVHGQFKEFETSTGRLSSSAPNLQNIPSKGQDGLAFRRCVQCVDAGRTLVIADYSQLELRLIAQMYNDATMRHMFNEGKDIHSFFAAEMLGISYDELEAGKNGPFKEKRTHAKPANFGLGYGAGATQFMHIAWVQYGIVLTKEDATRLRSMWLALFPGVAAHHKAMGAMLKAGTGDIRIRTQMGRTRRMQREWKNADGERKSAYAAAINHPVQGTGADGVKIAMVSLRPQLLNFHDAYLILNVHDELVVECDVAEAEQVKSLMVRTMIDSMQQFLPDVPCLVDAHIARDWKK